MCVTNSAFSLRKPKERCYCSHLSYAYCNSVLGIFTIHIFIMREIKLRSPQKIYMFLLGTLTALTYQQLSKKDPSFFKIHPSEHSIITPFGNIKPHSRYYLREDFLLFCNTQHTGCDISKLYMSFFQPWSSNCLNVNEGSTGNNECT